MAHLKFELFNDRLVAIKVVLLEVIQQFSPTGCHHKQASAGVKILAVCFKMFRKMGGQAVRRRCASLDPVSLSWERFSSIMFCLLTCSDITVTDFLTRGIHL